MAKVIVLVFLLLVACGGDSEEAPVVDDSPPPLSCDPNDYRNVMIECAGNPRSCRARNLCDG
jgi:hypothetical protein